MDPSCKKRNHYTAAEKLKILNFAKNTTFHRAAAKYGVDRKSLRQWSKKENQLMEMPKNKCAMRKSEVHWPKMEEHIINLVAKMRKDGYVVTRNFIRDEAIKWSFNNREMSVNFKASINWVSRFMKRHNLVLRLKTKIAQKLPADLETKLIDFQQYIIQKRTEYDFPLASIGNMDETPVQFDMIGNNTVDVKGAKTITVRSTGHEKSHFTAVLSCLANGVKLKPMVIFKRKTMPKEKFPIGVLVHVQEKGWMDEAGVNLWVREIWDKRPAAFNKRSLLVWDSFRGHLCDSVKNNLKAGRTETAVIPGGMTSICQPLDVSLNRPFKKNMRELWNDWMIHGEKTFTNSGNLKAPSLSMLCEFVIKAWDKVKTESVIKSFKKTSISNALDGSEDDLLWENEEADDSIENIAEDDIDEWDPYYDSNVDHKYLNEYMQGVINEHFNE